MSYLTKATLCCCIGSGAGPGAKTSQLLSQTVPLAPSQRPNRSNLSFAKRSVMTRAYSKTVSATQVHNDFVTGGINEGKKGRFDPPPPRPKRNHIKLGNVFIDISAILLPPPPTDLHHSHHYSQANQSPLGFQIPPASSGCGPVKTRFSSRLKNLTFYFVTQSFVTSNKFQKQCEHSTANN